MARHASTGRCSRAIAMATAYPVGNGPCHNGAATVSSGTIAGSELPDRRAGWRGTNGIAATAAAGKCYQQSARGGCAEAALRTPHRSLLRPNLGEGQRQAPGSSTPKVVLARTDFWTQPLYVGFVSWP